MINQMTCKLREMYCQACKQVCMHFISTSRMHESMVLTITSDIFDWKCRMLLVTHHTSGATILARELSALGTG